jgi:hypothetical protein
MLIERCMERLLRHRLAARRTYQRGARTSFPEPRVSIVALGTTVAKGQTSYSGATCGPRALVVYGWTTVTSVAGPKSTEPKPGAPLAAGSGEAPGVKFAAPGWTTTVLPTATSVDDPAVAWWYVVWSLSGTVTVDPLSSWTVIEVGETAVT